MLYYSIPIPISMHFQRTINEWNSTVQEPYYPCVLWKNTAIQYSFSSKCEPHLAFDSVDNPYAKRYAATMCRRERCPLSPTDRHFLAPKKRSPNRHLLGEFGSMRLEKSYQHPRPPTTNFLLRLPRLRNWYQY